MIIHMAGDISQNAVMKAHGKTYIEAGIWIPRIYLIISYFLVEGVKYNSLRGDHVRDGGSDYT